MDIHDVPASRWRPDACKPRCFPNSPFANTSLVSRIVDSYVGALCWSTGHRAGPPLLAELRSFFRCSFPAGSQG